MSAFFFILVILMGLTFTSKAQPTWTFNPFGKDKKPVEYEDKKLPSEKTADKKFTIFRHFLHNTTTHYNYYFNATNKLSMVLDRARASQKDDFTKLLSFYPYTLENTASQKVELDSVIYKCTAGILLHDLRSDWVDNMYLLIGQSYYYRKVFDSATMTFQFVNYNLFPRKKNEDDSRVVGGNVSEDGVRKLSIANKESRNIIKRTFSLPPSRNDALIWLARTYTETDQFGEAAGLINILQDDPNLPVRLKDELNQVTAYWFYRQEAYDSSASYLEKGLTSAENHTDKSRWYFLLGQMFEMSGDYKKAADYFDLAAKSTVDPLLDIYAHLNNAKMMKSNNDTVELNKSIASLLKMAGKDKYESYRDIIYHSAALLTLQKPDTSNALNLLEKSLRFNENNAEYKNKTHLLWGRISYIQRDYKSAANHYDSLDLKEPSLKNDSTEIADRKSSLRKIADQMMVIDNEDSLQAIAALPDIERDVFLKKLVKKLKKDKGQKDQKEEDWVAGPTLKSFDNGKNNGAVDLFSSSSKGEWYFYSATQKSKGYTEFKSKWGKRDNVDNWRRRSAMAVNNFGNGPGGADPLAPGPQDTATANAGGKPVDNSYDALLSNLPLTREQLEVSNKKIRAAFLELGSLFRNELQDYIQAIYFYELLLKRYPDEHGGGEVYLGLYHSYNKLGDKDKAAYYKALLDSGYSDSRFAKMINDPQSLQPEKNNPSTSKQYQKIYELFIEGSFDSAFAMKKAADKINGKQYWTAPLLYIEAMYYVKCARDSEAINTLQELITLYPSSSLKSKSETMIDVLRRRKEIEAYLNKLEVVRAPEDKRLMMPVETPVPVKNNVPQNAAPVPSPKLAPVKNIALSPDSALKLAPVVASGAFRWQPDQKHVVVMLLDKVDGVYINEARNAYNRYNMANRFSGISISRDTLNAEKALLVFSSFEGADEAIVYFDKVKKAAPTQVSWLPANKYQFFIVSENNLKLLQSNKDLEGYKKLLNNQYPGKF
jgi:tetratricopeptide (TPR) repeat protein